VGEYDENLKTRPFLEDWAKEGFVNIVEAAVAQHPIIFNTLNNM
jgi:hypothetical protein